MIKITDQKKIDDRFFTFKTRVVPSGETSQSLTVGATKRSADAPEEPPAQIAGVD